MALVTVVLSLIFSAWMLRRELRLRPGLSSALWIPTILLMLISSRPVAEWVGKGSPGDEASNPLDAGVYLCLIGASLFIGSSRGVKWGKLLAMNVPLLLLYAYFVSSIVWSDDPMGSAKRIGKDFALLFVIGLILSEKEPLQAIRSIFVRGASVLFPLSIVFDRWVPRFGREFAKNGTVAYSGVTTQKNSLGEIVLVFSMILLWDYLEIRSTGSRSRLLRGAQWDRLALLLMGALLLYQSQSKTSLFCLLIAVALGIRKGALATKPISIVAYAVVFSTPFFLFLSTEFGYLIEPIVKALGRDLTFTGRTNIWSQITLSTVNPILGCGYWVFWKGPGGAAISTAVQWTVPTAHCGYLDVYLDGGFLGLFLFFCVLAAYGWRLIKQSQKERFHLVGLAVLSAAIVYNLTESAFLRTGPLWFVVLVMIVEMPRKKRKGKYVQEELSNVNRTNRTQPAVVARFDSPAMTPVNVRTEVYGRSYRQTANNQR